MVFSSFPHSKITFPPPSILYFLEAQSTLKGVGYWAPFQRDRSIYINYLKFISKEDLSLSPYLFNQSFIYISVDSDIYFILGLESNTMLFILLLNLFLLWPLGAISGWLLCPLGLFIFMSCFLFFEHFLAFWHSNMLQAHLYSSFSPLESVISSRSPSCF